MYLRSRSLYLYLPEVVELAPEEFELAPVGPVPVEFEPEELVLAAVNLSI